MEKKIFFVVTLGAILRSLLIMGNGMSTDALNLANAQFEAKQYDAVIQTANNALPSCTYSDDTYYELMRIKALAYNWKNQNDSALSILKRVISVAEKNQRYSKSLAKSYRHYLRIASPDNYKMYEREIYRDFSIKLLELSNKKIKIFLEDYELYAKGLQNRVRAPHGEDSGEWKAFFDSLKKEETLAKNVKVIPFKAFFSQQCADIICDAHLYSHIFLTYPDGVNYAISYYNRAITSYKGYTTEFDEWLSECYRNLSELLSKNGFNEAALLNYEEYLKIQKKDQTFSWADVDHIKYLIATCNYTKGLEIVNKIISDSFFEELEDDEKEDIYYLQYKMNHLVNNEPYGPNNQSQFFHGDVSFSSDYIYLDYLMYIGVNTFTDSVKNYFNNPIHKIKNHILAYENTDEYRECLDIIREYGSDIPMRSKEDTILACKRIEWQIAVDIIEDIPWLDYKLLSNIYALEQNWEEAAYWQNLVVAVLKGRGDVSLYTINGLHHLWHNILVNIEFRETLSSAMYFCYAGRYEESALKYNEAIALYTRVLAKIFYSGSDAYKESEWEKHRVICEQIIDELWYYTEYYPPFADIIFQLSSMQKNFLANQKMAIYEIVKQNPNSKLKQLYAQHISLERQLESAYHKKQSDKIRELQTALAQIEVQMSPLLSLDEVISKSVLSAKDIQNVLKDDEVYVDFYLYVYGEQPDEKMICANVMRKGWTNPRNVIIGSTHFTDLEEYLSPNFSSKPDDQYKEVINSIANDEWYTHFLWDSIIEVGNIKPTEKIYFSPAGYLNQIALESSLWDTNTRMGDRYQMYRLSSAHELLKKKKHYNENDEIFAIGGLYYTQGIEISSLFKKKSSKTTSKMLAANKESKLSTNTQPILDRSDLIPRIGTKHQMRDIKNIFPDHADTLCGLNGTESVIRYKIENAKPQILHIATHGFNRVGSELTIEERNYLIGERFDNYVSPLENSMYETGLYLSPERYYSTSTTSDGILTAKEISYLDLSKTHLAVLSACSTTAGEITAEGIYGLPRGLKLAGVESLVVSLWDVNDNATEILMREFYTQLANGVSKRESLRRAQKYVETYRDRNITEGTEYPYASPYYWAAFILIDGNE